MTKRKRKLTAADLRALGVRPGLQAIRYGADGERVMVKQLTSEAKAKPGPPFGPGLTHTDELTRDSERG